MPPYPIDHCRGNRRRSDGFASPAGILWADMTMDKEFGRLDVQLFGDVFVDLDQVLAALISSTGFGFVAVLDAGVNDPVRAGVRRTDV